MEVRDKPWTFPASDTPSVSSLRECVATTAQSLIRRVRKGELPLQVASSPFREPIGWEHWHTHPELFLQLGGQSRFETPTGALHLEEGNLLLFPPLSAHREYVAGRRASFQNLVFTMADRDVSYHLAMASRDGHPWPQIVLPDLLTADAPMAASLLWMLASDDPDVRAGSLLAFLGVVKRASLAARLPTAVESDRVRQAQRLIRSRLGSASLSVVQVAAWVGCSPDHLTRTFRRETGKTVVSFISEERLRLARTLLSDPRMRVLDVARLTGFLDPAYFSRAYRRRYGSAPSARSSSN